MSPDQRTLVWVSVAVSAFIALVVGTIVSMGIGVLSLLYLGYAAIWGAILKSAVFPDSKLETAETHASMHVPLALGALINIAFGLYAFVDYWSTRDHLVSLQIVMNTLLYTIPIFFVSNMVKQGLTVATKTLLISAAALLFLIVASLAYKHAIRMVNEHSWPRLMATVKTSWVDIQKDSKARKYCPNLIVTYAYKGHSYRSPLRMLCSAEDDWTKTTNNGFPPGSQVEVSVNPKDPNDIGAPNFVKTSIYILILLVITGLPMAAIVYLWRIPIREQPDEETTETY